MKDIVGLLKLPPRILAGLLIASGIILFSPESIIKMLYMTEFKKEYGFIIGSTFIVSASILACLLVLEVGKRFRRCYLDRRLLKLRKEFMSRLGMEEKEILCEMLQTSGYTLNLPMQHGTVIKLKYYDVITPAGGTHLVNPLDMCIPYFVQPWAVKMLEERPDYLAF